VGIFVEGLIPLMAYAVLCSTTRDHNLLEKDQVISLLLSGRNTRRVIFKNCRQAAGKVFRCFIKNNDDESIARVSEKL